jgi:hypothetical protein
LQRLAPGALDDAIIGDRIINGHDLERIGGVVIVEHNLSAHSHARE